MRTRASTGQARMRTARRAEDIQPFEVMDVLARAYELEAAGRRVIHMEIGEPDFTATAPAVEAGVRALRDGATAYTPSLGLPALRQAISRHYAERFATQVPAAQIVVTSGASSALLLALATYVEAGDEILVPDPGYPGYRHLVRTFEGVARAIAVEAADDFQPTLESVRAAWGERTIGVLLGTPSNPSGTVVRPGELERIAAFVAERGGVLIVDEIYQGLVYGSEPRTAAGLPGEVVLVNSFSKYFCMTGWRVGWAVVPPERVRTLEKLAQHLYICAPSAAQHAAIAAFQPASIRTLEARRQEFARRRDFLVPALERAGLRVPAYPTGAFYIYADCTAVGDDAKRLALELLEREGVAATPGVDFGRNRTRSFLRFAYTRSLADLEEGAARIARFCARA
jgi:aspartate/methionine/tyrosine aminotransferase